MIDEFGAETVWLEHFGLRYSETEYIVRCVDCPWGFQQRGPKTARGAQDAWKACAEHAVEFHNCTYKKNPATQ